MPATLQSRPVVYKQTSAGLYQEFPYVWCVVLVSIPVAIVADTIFGSLVYWISNWTPQVDRYFVFLLTLLLVDLTIASLFRFNMYAFSSQVRDARQCKRAARRAAADSPPHQQRDPACCVDCRRRARRLVWQSYRECGQQRS